MPDSLNIEPAIPVSVLVTYATCHGSTKEIAEAIAKELQDGELKVDLQPVGEVRKLDGYQAVIIGSAVHRGHWLPEALDFRQCQPASAQPIAVALFTVHITNPGNDENSRKNRLSYLDSIRPMLKPVSEGFFLGRFNRRGAAMLMPRWLSWIVPSMDFRNWKKIRAWSEEVRPLLLL